MVTVPDNFMQEQETTISQMVSLADDPKMKAIVVVAEGVPGTYPAFKAIREKRPDILLFVNNNSRRSSTSKYSRRCGREIQIQ